MASLLLSAGLAAPLLAGCSTALERRLGEAERLRAEAAAADGEWLQTEALLQQARKAAAGGDADAAMVLAGEAAFEAEAAIRQARHEAEAWRERVVR